MRLLAMVLVLIGIAGIGFGVMQIMHASIPFRFENYGGPGPVLGGFILVVGGLYVSSLRPRRG